MINSFATADTSTALWPNLDMLPFPTRNKHLLHLLHNA